MEKYFIEVETEGCKHCGTGFSWRIVKPDGSMHSATYDDMDVAQEIADIFNEAFDAGVTAAKNGDC